MQLQFKKPGPDERSTLRSQLSRLRDPACAQEMLSSHVPSISRSAQSTCTLCSLHPDRFVLRVDLLQKRGLRRSYALKVYAGDSGRKVWDLSQAIRATCTDASSLCLPIAYVPSQRLLILPWVDGVPLSCIREPRLFRGLLEDAANLTANIHRSGIVPEAETTPQMILEEAMARIERLYKRWPEARETVQPAVIALSQAFEFLHPSVPALVHGDVAPEHFLWTGTQLVVLDMDMFGYTDPAYDGGHFLAQLQRLCLSETSLSKHCFQLINSFRSTYQTAAPCVSAGNVSFYHGLTLLRKIYTVSRLQTPQRPRIASLLSQYAQAAFNELVSWKINK